MEPDNVTPFVPGQDMGLRLNKAMKWLKDMADIGNDDAKVVRHLLNLTLIEDQQIKATLMMRLAPLMKTTIGANVAKKDLLQALMPISHLLGGPPQPQAGNPSFNPDLEA